MARILFVAKDNGCASVTEQVAVLARDDGQKVIIATEGLAMTRFEKFGFNLNEDHNFKGMLDFRAPTVEEENIHFDAREYLDKVAPDVVVMGLGSPINIQAQIAEEATRRNIPLVICEDFWAKSVSHLSDKVNPTLILTVDDYSVELVKRAFPKTRVLVVGNPGLEKVQVQESVQTKMDALRSEFDKIYVYAGGGPDSTTAELELLIRCLKKTDGRCCVVPRFHPKFEKFQMPSMEKPYGELWRDYLKPFHQYVRFVDVSPTDPTVVIAGDTVFAGFSTLLSTAIWNGVPAVCLKTAETVKLLKEHGSHYTEIPQVALGLVPAVTKPTDLSQFKMPSNEVLQKLVPYDAQSAYKYIQELLSQ